MYSKIELTSQVEYRKNSPQEVFYFTDCYFKKKLVISSKLYLNL